MNSSVLEIRLDRGKTMGMEWGWLLSDHEALLDVPLSLSLELEATEKLRLRGFVIDFVSCRFWELLLLFGFLDIGWYEVPWCFLIDHVLFKNKRSLGNWIVTRPRNSFFWLHVRVHVVPRFDIIVECSYSRLIDIMIPEFESVVWAEVWTFIFSVHVAYHVFGRHQPIAYWWSCVSVRSLAPWLCIYNLDSSWGSWWSFSANWREIILSWRNHCLTSLVLKWKSLTTNTLESSWWDKIQVPLQSNIPRLFYRPEQLASSSGSWNRSLGISWAQSSLLILNVTKIKLWIVPRREMLWCPRTFHLNSNISGRVIRLWSVHELSGRHHIVIRSSRHEVILLVLIPILVF